MWLSILAIWGCIPELTKDCIDMTNSSSTYLGIVGGAAIGAVISWWIYNRQKKTSRKQDDILRRIEKVETKNRHIIVIPIQYFTVKNLKLVLNCTRNFDAHHPYDPYHPYFNLNSYTVDGRDGVVKSL